MNKLLSGLIFSSIVMVATVSFNLSQPGSASANSLFIQQTAPLTTSQLEDLVRNSTPDSAIVYEIQRRRLAFRVTENILARLEKLGAGPETIRALKKSVRPQTGTLRVDRGPKDSDKMNPLSSRGEPVPTAKPGAIMILVADFVGPDPENYLVTQKIIQQLRVATGTYRPLTNVQALRRPIVEQGGSEVARAIGKQYNANIVLWGYYGATSDRVDVSVYYEVLQAPKNLCLKQNLETENTSIKDLKEFKLQTRLSGKMTYLVLLTTGLARYEAHDYAGAVDRFTKALSQSDVPEQIIEPADIYYRRGLAYYYGIGANEQALADFDKAIEIKSDFTNAYFSRGIFYLQKGPFDRAIDDFSKVIELEPADAIAYYNRALVYDQMKQFERAIADYDHALRLKHDFVCAFNNRGVIYASMNQQGRAIADFDRAIELKPDFANAYTNRGISYSSMNQYGRAIADYDKAIELKPDFANAYRGRGNVFSKMNQYGRAIADYDKAIELKPEVANGYRNRGTVFFKMNQYLRAIADYDKAIGLKPDDTVSYFNRGLAYARINQHERAISDYDKAIELKPDDADAYYSRGISYGETGQHERAIADYDKAIELKPDDADGYYARAIAYGEINQHERAIADYKSVLRITKDPKLRQNVEEKLKELRVR